MLRVMTVILGFSAHAGIRADPVKSRAKSFTAFAETRVAFDIWFSISSRFAVSDGAKASASRRARIRKRCCKQIQTDCGGPLLNARANCVEPVLIPEVGKVRRADRAARTARWRNGGSHGRWPQSTEG